MKLNVPSVRRGAKEEMAQNCSLPLWKKRKLKRKLSAWTILKKEGLRQSVKLEVVTISQNERGGIGGTWGGRIGPTNPMLSLPQLYVLMMSYSLYHQDNLEFVVNTLSQFICTRKLAKLRF